MRSSITRRSFVAAAGTGVMAPLFVPSTLLGRLGRVGVNDQIGVGFIMMPILNRVMGLDLVRTNMHKVFIVAPYTLVALLVFASQVELMWLAGIALAVGSSIGGYLGTHFMVRSSERTIRLVLNLILVVFIIKLLFDS